MIKYESDLFPELENLCRRTILQAKIRERKMKVTNTFNLDCQTQIHERAALLYLKTEISNFEIR
jgi:hypothetical protein